MAKMHYDYTYEQASKIAKAKDIDGSLALKGMDLFIGNFNNCPNDSVGCNEAIAYLTNTYLECIDGQDFFEWVTQGNENGQPLILSEWRFKEVFQEISDLNFTLKGITETIAVLYGQEWWIFGYEDYDIFLATTTWKDNYNKLDIIGVHKAMSTFCTLFDVNKITPKAREEFIKNINESANNFFDGYKIDKMSNSELIEEISLKLGLSYI